MNTTRCMLLSISIMGLSACAASAPMARSPAADRPPGGVLITRDAEYITQVERHARRRGIEVQWVHPPSKRITTD